MRSCHAAELLQRGVTGGRACVLGRELGRRRWSRREGGGECAARGGGLESSRSSGLESWTQPKPGPVAQSSPSPLA